ncbi:hypothetical protein FNV43_RR11165 [Rhamnella rubrinervis]|uniref:Uncharacterized protein n=1 Tax=Rhamnella rubrinervis TaxID=2594499 RepID=A0A8K0MHG9_9ROSA|nr:hypothetical protein FNV43_RR11165 [Rhamnella rubrinervis]
MAKILMGLLPTVGSCGRGDSKLSSRTWKEPLRVSKTDGEEQEEEEDDDDDDDDEEEDEEEEDHKEWRENNNTRMRKR